MLAPGVLLCVLPCCEDSGCTLLRPAGGVPSSLSMAAAARSVMRSWRDAWEDSGSRLVRSVYQTHRLGRSVENDLSDMSVECGFALLCPVLAKWMQMTSEKLTCACSFGSYCGSYHPLACRGTHRCMQEQYIDDENDQVHRGQFCCRQNYEFILRQMYTSFCPTTAKAGWGC